ncbi:MAG: 50S ribosomal protein L29, partial [Candidatus Iainarchaeum archaeon]
KERAIIESGTRPEKPSKIKNIKRDVARILTILNERKKSRTTNKKEVKGKK